MNQDEKEIELYDYIEVLLKYKWFILVVTLICGASGWFLRAEPPPPIYTADAVLMIKNRPTQQTATEDAPSATQSTGFYEALATADDLKKALIDSLDLNRSTRSMDGMFEVAVLDPGIKLVVRSEDPQLSLDLVNAWAGLFVKRNSYINAEEGGEYFSYIDKQDSTSRSRLEATEQAIYDFEKKNRIGFLKFQQAVYDTALTAVYKELFKLNSILDEQVLEFELTSEQYLYGMEDHHPLIDIKDVLTVPGIMKMQTQLRHEKISALQYFDEVTHFTLQKNRIDSLESQIDLLESQQKSQMLATEADSLKIEMTIIEQELSRHPPTLQPLYANLISNLVSTRMKFERLKLVLKESPSRPHVDVAPGLIEIHEEYAQLQAERAQLQTEREKLAAHRDLQYEQAQKVLGLLIRKNHLEAQFASSQKSIAAVKDSLSLKLNRQQRLARDQTIFEETVSRFSKLAEQARISREKSAGDISVLTRALEAKTIHQTAGPQKTAMAAGFGFLISTILSLLIEYVRKARQIRMANNAA